MRHETYSDKRRFADLPVRPEPVYGESLPGYLWRLADANGHEYANLPISGVVGRRPAAVLQRMPSMLFDFFGVERIQPLLEADWVHLRLLQAVEFGAWQANREVCRLCPDCIRERGIHMAQHTLPLVAACRKHGRWLLHHCASCGAKPTWRCIYLGWTCRWCGAQLLDWLMPVAPRWVLRTIEAVLLEVCPWVAARLDKGTDLEGNPVCPYPIKKPTRAFSEYMNRKLGEAYRIAFKIDAGSISAHRLNRTAPFWRNPIDPSFQKMSPRERDLLEFLFEGTEELTSLDPLPVWESS